MARLHEHTVRRLHPYIHTCAFTHLHAYTLARLHGHMLSHVHPYQFTHPRAYTFAGVHALLSCMTSLGTRWHICTLAQIHAYTLTRCAFTLTRTRTYTLHTYILIYLGTYTPCTLVHLRGHPLAPLHTHTRFCICTLKLVCLHARTTPHADAC
jgi:hypothetical protein